MRGGPTISNRSVASTRTGARAMWESTSLLQLRCTPRISRPNRKALMTETQKKVALLIGAALIIVPIALIRTRSAMQGERRSINWEEKMKVSVEAKAPDWYHTARCCHRY